MHDAAATSKGVEPRIPKQKVHVNQGFIFWQLKLVELTVTVTKANATILQEVAEMIKHGSLVLATDTAEIAEESATVCDHSGKSNFLFGKKNGAVWLDKRSNRFVHLFEIISS